jgi:hypothetical protein
LKTSENDVERKAVEVYFILRESDGSTISRILDEFILKQGVVDTRILLKELLPAMFSLDPEDIDKLMGAAKETEYWRFTKEVLEKMQESLQKVLSHE